MGTGWFRNVGDAAECRCGIPVPCSRIPDLRSADCVGLFPSDVVDHGLGIGIDRDRPLWWALIAHMTLSRRLLLTLGLDLTALGLTYFYFWRFRRDYMFPDRYEDAYRAVVFVAIVAVLALVVVIAFHFVWRRRRNAE